VSENLDNLEGWMSRLPDQELVRMVTTDSDKFDQRKIAFAEEELRVRGIQVERHGSDLRTMPPDVTEATPRNVTEATPPHVTGATSHNTVIAGGRIMPVVHGVVIVWVLTAIAGAVASIVKSALQLSPPEGLLISGAFSFLLGTVAFTIVGCKAPPGNRWRHLAFVALATWLTSLINVLLFGVGIVQWIAGVIVVAMYMAMGGALSYIFKGETSPPA
jgi:hypothetical protein